MSKGSRQRPVDQETFNANFDRIFGTDRARWWDTCPGCGGRHIKYNPIDQLATCQTCTNLFNEGDTR